jgi:hypothetical protein
VKFAWRGFTGALLRCAPAFLLTAAIASTSRIDMLKGPVWLLKHNTDFKKDTA